MPSTYVFDSLTEIPDACASLINEAAHHSFFLSLPWYTNFIQHIFTQADRLRIYAVMSDDGEKTLGMLLMKHRIATNKLFSPRVLSPVSNYYTSLVEPIIAAELCEAEPIIDTLVRSIVSDSMSWDIIDVHPLDVDGPGYELLNKALRRSGMIVQRYFCFGNWYLEVGSRTFNEYFTSLPSQLRNTIKRKKKQLDSIYGSRIEIISSETGLERAIDAYERIYQASWKIPEPYPEFIRGLVLTSAALGWLRMGLIYVNDEPAAAQIWIVNGRTAAIYKLAYDKRFSHLSVGSILTAQLMEYVIDVDRVNKVDYLTGDDEYKKDWMSHRRERWGIIAFNQRTVKGLIAATWHVGGRAIRRAGRALLSPRDAEVVT